MCVWIRSELFYMEDSLYNVWIGTELAFWPVFDMYKGISAAHGSIEKPLIVWQRNWVHHNIAVTEASSVCPTNKGRFFLIESNGHRRVTDFELDQLYSAFWNEITKCGIAWLVCIICWIRKRRKPVYLYLLCYMLVEPSFFLYDLELKAIM